MGKADMKYTTTIATMGWQIYEKVNPFMDAWQVGSWVWEHVHLLG